MVAVTAGITIPHATAADTTKSSTNADRSFKANPKAEKTREQMIAAAFATKNAETRGASPATSPPALVPTTPFPACVGQSSIYNWPIVYAVGNPSVPCYVHDLGGFPVHIVGPNNQTLMPNSTLQMTIADSPGGWPDQGAFLLSWNNLFDYEPVMRGSDDTPANDISGEDSHWAIPPQLDDTGCYDPSRFFLQGRFVNTCTIKFGKGPYYGTPAGQTIPYTVFLASTLANGAVYNSPLPNNCGGTCDFNIHSNSAAYVEMPAFIEPSPYANFTDTVHNATVQFTDATLSDLQITSWNWNFGDGTTSSEQSPVHNYAHGGTYPVTMSMQTSDGQTDTYTTNVAISAQYNLSGAVKDLSNNGVKTTLTLKKTSDGSTQQVNVGDDGKYSIGVDAGNYKLAPAGSVPAGVFTPASKNISVDANKVVNFTVNARRINVTVTNNNGRPVPGISVPVAGSGSVLGAIVTDGTGKGHAEATAGSYTLTPTDLHPGQGYQFIPPSAPVTIASADVSRAFQYKAAVFVSSVTPNSGPAKGGTSVTVTGGGFMQGGVASVSAVRFRVPAGKSVAGKDVVVSSDSLLTVTTPKAAPIFGASDTSVSTDTLVTSGPYTSLTTPDDNFVFGNVPSVTKVAVNDGPINGGTKIVITGQHFTGATNLTFEPLDSASLPVLKAKTYTIDSDTQISATVPGMDFSALYLATQRLADIRVKTPDGTSPTGTSDRYTYRGDNVVQLGDSIASGEGINYGFTYDNTTQLWTKAVDNPVWAGAYQDCHQSVQAASTAIAYGIRGNVTNFGCTGGTYANGIAGDQPDEGAPAQFGVYPGGPLNPLYDTANPDVVLISMGADDVRFVDIIKHCIASYTHYLLTGNHDNLTCIPSRPGAATQQDFFQNVDGVGDHLATLVGQIEQRGLDSPGHASPKIVVQDYYNPFPSPGTPDCNDTSMFDSEQVPYISSIVDKLDTKIATAIKAIARADKNVQFVELHDAIINNRWCSSDPEAYGISIVTKNHDRTNPAPFHPNPAGQQAIADAVLPAVQDLVKPSK